MKHATVLGFPLDCKWYQSVVGTLHMLSLHIVAGLVVVGCSCVVTNRTAILRHFPVQIHASQIPRDQNNAKLRITVHSHSSHSAMSLIYHDCSYFLLRR